MVNVLLSYFKGSRYSLSATFFRNRVIGALRLSEDSSVHRAAQSVSSNLIFEHPTIEQLAIAIDTFVNPSSASVFQAHSVVGSIRAMIAKYTADLPTVQAKGKANNYITPVVLLTGSTGNIGSHILAYLLSEERVARVYTLNRLSADPLGRLRSAFSERGLPAELLDDPRLVSLAGDITLDNFSLDEIQYKEVSTADFSMRLKTEVPFDRS